MLKRGKKLTGAIISIREQKMVQVEILSLPKPMADEHGEIKTGASGADLYTFTAKGIDTRIPGEENKYWADGGLRGAFKLAEVKPGMKLEILHTGEREIEVPAKDGQKAIKGTVQTYDIFILE